MSIFTPAALQQMCEVENIVLGHYTYPEMCPMGSSGDVCAPQERSILSFFYPPGPNGLARNCSLLDELSVSTIAASIYAAGSSSDPSTAAAARIFLDKGTYTSSLPKTMATRSMISFALPLAGYKSHKKKKKKQQAIIESALELYEKEFFKYFGQSGGLFSSPYRKPAQTALLDVKWYSGALSQEEFRR